jgi:hypothetical protein
MMHFGGPSDPVRDHVSETSNGAYGLISIRNADMARNGRRFVKAAGRRLQARGAAERLADSARLVLDSRSDPVYQPVAELGRRYVTADRRTGTASRWSAMAPLLAEFGPETAVDVGCNAGWFVLELGRLGIATIGIEEHPPYYRAAITAVKRSGLRNVAIMTLALRPGMTELLPSVDCVLLLSVWHHFVRAHGLTVATSLLQAVWRHTNTVMFFETGESDEFRSSEYGLPEMDPDAPTWLTSYLTKTCDNADIIHLGIHPSGPGSNATRNLFAVKRCAR